MSLPVTIERAGTVTRTGLLNAFRAEALKSRHGAPLGMSILMAFPMPLLAALLSYAGPEPVMQYSPWNYWYVLFLPVLVVLVAATVANYDARIGNRALLSSGVPLGNLWTAKVLWCLSLSLLANLLVFCLNAVLALFAPQGAVSVVDMAAAALVMTITSSWLVPLTLLLTMRFGKLSGVIVPVAIQIGGSIAWSAVPYWPLLPPIAAIVAPTSFLPVLPTGESSWADAALTASLTRPVDLLAALSVSTLVTVLLVKSGASWLKRSEETR